MSATEADVLEIRAKLEKIIAGTKEMSVAVELIAALQNTPMTLEILTTTRIGMTLNDLRKKSTDDKISKTSRALIKKWKNLVEGKMVRSDSECRSLKSLSQEPETNGVESCPSESGLSETQNASQGSNSSSTKPNGQIDPLRSKTIQLLKNALTNSGQTLSDDTLDPDELAMRIEDKLYEHYKGTNEKYRASVRSRIFNLRDKKNQALCENLLSGALPPAKFALMTAEEMASDEMKSLRERFTKESIDDHQMAVQEGTPTDMFRCAKCKSNNCTYSQMQTRSADEPMTTFVFCRSCGNRWKFC